LKEVTNVESKKWGRRWGITKRPPRAKSAQDDPKTSIHGKNHEKHKNFFLRGEREKEALQEGRTPFVPN